MVPLIVLVLWVLGSIGQAAWATTYYVAASGGNDSNDGSESSPFATVKKGIELLVAGDTLLIRGGTHNITGEMRLDTPGTSTSPIRIANYPGEAPRLFCTDGNNGANPQQILIQHSAGHKNAMGWITIEGLEFDSCYSAIKWYNLHDSAIVGNWSHHSFHTHYFGGGGLRVRIERNLLERAATTDPATNAHGLYLHGGSYVIRNNIIVGNEGIGIQQNGSSSANYSSASHPDPAFAGAANWIVEGNTIAYQVNGGAYVLWGSQCTNARIENNIFYENRSAGATNDNNGIRFTSGSCTGVTIRNNYSYASGSGGTLLLNGTGMTEGVTYTQSGNVVNTTNPPFVNGGSNALPASPDFRLTATSPLNIARANEFLNNSTNVVGAYKTVATPTGTITQNRIRLTFPMSTAVPIQNLSTAGVTLSCTGSNCPGGGLTASSVSRVVGTDTQVDIIVSGFASDACVATNQAVTVTYNSGSGTWTGNDNIGVFPGSHQPIFSFSDLALDNQCTGSGPTSPPGTAHVWLKFDGDHTDSSGNGFNGTPTGTPTFVEAKHEQGMQLRIDEQVNSTVGYGSGVALGSQSLTIVGGIRVDPGAEALSKTYGGTPFLSGRNLHWSTISGTWRFAVGDQSIVSAASEFAVTPGDHRVCLRIDSSTNTATLAIDGQTGTTAGSVKTYSDFTSSGNFSFGLPPDFQLSGAPGGVLDDWKIFTSLIDCADDYAAWNTTAPTQTGTFGQAAVQFEAVYLPELGGNSTVLSSPNNSKSVVSGGAVAIVAQIHCENVSDCEETAFQFTYRTNGTGSWLQVPNAPTADGFFMWGADINTLLNAGETSTRITGSCTITNGVTLLTASQIPSIDLPQDGCVMLRWIVRVADTATGFAEFRVQREGGTAFTGTEVLARINVIEKQAGGMGF